MTLRLVISDVDGTLVDSEKRLTDATVAAVGRLEAAGVPFSLISARPPSGLRWIVERLGISGETAAFNGGTIMDGAGKVIERHVLDEGAVRTSFRIAEGSGAVPWLFAGGVWHCPDTDSDHVAHEIKSANQQPTVTPDMTPLFGDVDKITWVSNDEALLRDLTERMRAEIGDGATIGQSQTYYLDLTHPKANKGAGVTTLAAHAGVPLSDVAVLGDQANDLPMFAVAGTSVVMGQAPADVRAKARYTSTTNDEDGVAHAIDTILLPMTKGTQ